VMKNNYGYISNLLDSKNLIICKTYGLNSNNMKK